MEGKSRGTKGKEASDDFIHSLTEQLFLSPYYVTGSSLASKHPGAPRNNQ